MKKLTKSIIFSLLALILIATPVLAAYTALIQVITTTTAYTELPVITDMDNDQLVTQNYITSTGLDTRVQVSGSDLPHMLASDKTVFSTDLTAGGTSNFQFVTGESALPNFDIITGYNGYITIADAAALEIDDEFTIEIEDCYIHTAVAAGCDIVSKGTDFSIYTGDVAGEVTAAIVGDATYSPDAHIEVTSVDGYVQLGNAAGLTWAAIHDAAAGNIPDDVGALTYAGWRCDGLADKWDQLQRTFLLFDTSPLPPGVTIISATVSIFGTNKEDDKPWGDLTVNVFASNPAANTVLANADYDQVSAVPFATEITYAGYDAAGWNIFTLNAAGIAAIDDAGITKFSVREAEYDAPDSPPVWDNGSDARFTFQTADGANAPVLTVTYFAAAVTAINVTTGKHDIDVTADGVDMEISIDGAVAGDYYDTVVLGGVAVPDNGDDWILMNNYTTDFMPYMSYYKHTTAIGGVSLKAWYQPIDIIVNTTFDGIADAGSDADTIIDAALTQADDYWIGALVTITEAGAAAPEGETSICTAFADATDEVTVTPPFSAVVAAGDSYTIEFGTLVDRQAGDEDARITWGVNPADISYTVGSLISTDITIPATAATAQDILPTGAPVSLWGMVAPVNAFSDIVTSLATSANVPSVIIWVILALMFTIGSTLIVYLQVKDIMVAAIWGAFILILFAVVGVVPKWAVLLAVLITALPALTRREA